MVNFKIPRRLHKHLSAVGVVADILPTFRPGKLLIIYIYLEHVVDLVNSKQKYGLQGPIGLVLLLLLGIRRTERQTDVHCEGRFLQGVKGLEPGE